MRTRTRAHVTALGRARAPVVTPGDPSLTEENASVMVWPLTMHRFAIHRSHDVRRASHASCAKPWSGALMAVQVLEVAS
jgi:hypothetical protein